jgi:hypothetical protein
MVWSSRSTAERIAEGAVGPCSTSSVILDSHIASSSGVAESAAPPLRLLDLRSAATRRGAPRAGVRQPEPKVSATGLDVSARERARRALLRRETLQRVKRWLSKLGVCPADVDDVTQSVMTCPSKTPGGER